LQAAELGVQCFQVAPDRLHISAKSRDAHFRLDAVFEKAGAGTVLEEDAIGRKEALLLRHHPDRAAYGVIHGKNINEIQWKKDIPDVDIPAAHALAVALAFGQETLRVMHQIDFGRLDTGADRLQASLVLSSETVYDSTRPDYGGPYPHKAFFPARLFFRPDL
jgi:hypothetical protein